MNKRYKQILYIKNIFHDVKSITIPVVQGFVHKVYIVKTKENKKYICRFSNQITAQHNFYVSKLLISNNIKAPEISLHKFEDIYCETYPFLEGDTLYQRLLVGISPTKIDKIYQQLFDLLCKISDLKYDSKSVCSHENILAKMANKFFCVANPQEKNVLTPIDLNPKNILLDKDDNVCALLDLDSIDKRNFSYSFVSMMSWAKTSDYIPQDLIEKYSSTHPKPNINIRKQIQIYNFLVRLYIDIVRKHMLNFKGK